LGYWARLSPDFPRCPLAGSPLAGTGRSRRPRHGVRRAPGAKSDGSESDRDGQPLQSQARRSDLACFRETGGSQPAKGGVDGGDARACALRDFSPADRLLAACPSKHHPQHPGIEVHGRTISAQLNGCIVCRGCMGRKPFISPLREEGARPQEAQARRRRRRDVPAPFHCLRGRFLRSK